MLLYYHVAGFDIQQMSLPKVILDENLPRRADGQRYHASLVNLELEDTLRPP